MVDTPSSPINPSNFPNPTSGGPTTSEMASFQRKLETEAKKLGIIFERSYIDAYKKIGKIGEAFHRNVLALERKRFDELAQRTKRQFAEEVRNLQKKGEWERNQTRLKEKYIKDLAQAETKARSDVARHTQLKEETSGRAGGLLTKGVASIPLVGNLASTLIEAGPVAAGSAAFAAALGSLTAALFEAGTQSTRTSIAFTKAGVAQKSWNDVFSALQTGQFASIANANDVAHFIDILSEAPQELGKASQDNFQSVKNFIGAMGNFGIPLEDSVKLITAASRSWGGSTQDLNKQMVLASKLMGVTGFDFGTLYSIMQDLDPAMKSLTFSAGNAGTAARMLAATLAIKLGKQGLGLTQEEVGQATKSMGNFLESMSTDKWAGIIGFTKGTLPDFQEVLSTINNPMKAFSTYLDFARKSLENVPQAQRGYAVQGLVQQGLAAGAFQGPKGAAEFLRILQTSPEDQKAIKTAMVEMEKSLNDANKTADMREKGLQALANLHTPIGLLEKRLENLFVAIASKGGLTDAVHQLNSEIAHPGRALGKAVTSTLTSPLTMPENVLKKVADHLLQNTSSSPKR